MTQVQSDARAVERLTEEVIAVYDQYRMALLNLKYYGAKLAKTRNHNFWLEFILAVAASGVVGSWAIWQDKALGSMVWAGFAGFTTLLAIAKPLLQLGSEIERVTRLFVSYGEITAELERLVEEIRIEQAFTPEMALRYRHQVGRFGHLEHLDDPNPKRATLEQFQDEVEKQVPDERLWVPQQVQV